MIAAMCELYLVSRKEMYLRAAVDADRFIQRHLCESETLYVSFHMEKRGVEGFLDDYSSYIFAQMSLYRATLESEYLNRAKRLCNKVISDFGDNTGGFYLYGISHQELILRPKETYDGATPSGNSLMSYNLVRLSLLTNEDKYEKEARRQIDFLSQTATLYPMNHAMFLRSLLEHTKPPMKITVVLNEQTQKSSLPLLFPPDAIVILLSQPTKEYPLKKGKTTYYLCRGHSCLPPTNDLNELSENANTE